MLISSRFLKLWLLFSGVFLLAASPVYSDPLLGGLIDEALKNSPEIQASQARIEAARLRIPQSGSLPDPMFMFGYQNETFDRYTYGEMQGSQWMFSATTISVSGQAQAQRRNDSAGRGELGSHA
jgi:cobalt-zinc-cadmium efflux system outer membrane protein